MLLTYDGTSIFASGFVRSRFDTFHVQMYPEPRHQPTRSTLPYAAATTLPVLFHATDVTCKSAFSYIGAASVWMASRVVRSRSQSTS
eukprot:gene11868-biopygen11940